MNAQQIPHLSDMMLRSLIARPASGLRADHTPWPADTHAVMVSTVRLPQLPRAGGGISRVVYETAVFTVNDIDATSSNPCAFTYGDDHSIENSSTAADALLCHTDAVLFWSDTVTHDPYTAMNHL